MKGWIGRMLLRLKCWSCGHHFMFEGDLSRMWAKARCSRCGNHFAYHYQTTEVLRWSSSFEDCYEEFGVPRK